MRDRDNERSGRGDWRRGRSGRDDPRGGGEDWEARSWDDRRNPYEHRGGFGEGGYPERGGRSGYGARGYGAEQDEGRHDRRGMNTAPTYGDTREDYLARRSEWREDQRYGDRNETGESWTSGARDYEHGGVDRRSQDGWRTRDHSWDEDHEPHYRSWRDQQLAGHDRDYARWRDERSRQYDDQYRTWRDQRRESFSKDFHSWRSQQGDHTHDSSTSPTGTGDSPTGMSGAAIGVRGAQTGHAGGGSSWSDVGGGVTSAAGITGGSGAVNPQTNMSGTSIGTAPGGGSGGHASTGSGAQTRTATEQVQDVADGHSRSHGKDSEERKH